LKYIFQETIKTYTINRKLHHGFLSILCTLNFKQKLLIIIRISKEGPLSSWPLWVLVQIYW